MTTLELNIPQGAIDSIQAQLDKHNDATGAQIKIVPFLERHLLELAAQPHLREVIPTLEAKRDEDFAVAIRSATEGIIRGFEGHTPPLTPRRERG